MKSIYNFLALSLFVIFATACKSDPLEDYFVKASESADFFVVNIPASIVEFDTEKIDKKTLEEIKTIKKANILLYKNDYDTSVKKAEFNKAKNIITSKNFKVLTKIKNKDYYMSFAYQGEPDKIDEFIFLGNNKDNDFLIGLVKGKDININHLVDALKHIKKVDESQAKTILEMIKPDK